MHLTQVFKVENDLKITWKTSYDVTCEASNNETSNSRANEDSMQDIIWDASQGISWDVRNDVSWRARNLFAWKIRNFNLAILIVFSVACITWTIEIFGNFKTDVRLSNVFIRLLNL